MSQVVTLVLSESKRWTSNAACAEEGVAPMFPSDQDAKGVEYAKSICGRCPVRDACLSEALDRGEAFGVWGGYTADERRAMRRQDSRRKAATQALTAAEATATDVAATPGYRDPNPYNRPKVG